MKLIGTFFLVLTGILLSSISNAQFVLSGEIRPRTELSRGYKTLATTNQDASLITGQRSRINLLFQTNYVKTGLVLQDVRLWGSQPQLVTNHDFAVSVHEAWAEVNLKPLFSVKAGRQELAYDDHRILGNVGWAHQARSHDVAIIKYTGNVSVHLGIAHHENENIRDNFYDGPDAYKDMQFLWFNVKNNQNSLSLLLLNNGVPKTEGNNQLTIYSHTLGGRYTFKTSAFGFATNLYYQIGEHVSGKKINALNFLAEATIPAGFTVGIEHLSGTDYNETSKVKSFTPFYGTNHKFNGFMDYFFVGNHIGSVGLNDVYLKYSFSKNKIGINADLHYFGAAAKISAESPQYLGTELDISVSWLVQPAAKISGGFSRMFAGKSMQTIKGGDYKTAQNWAYVMLSVTPVFINK